MHKSKIVIALLAMTLALSGCGQFKSLPNKERYQYINEVKNGVDLSSAGNIVEGGYDNGDGIISPSIYSVKIEGKDVYQTLKERIKILPEIKNCIEGEVQITCKKGQVDIFLSKSGLPESTAVFELTDRYSGKD